MTTSRRRLGLRMLAPALVLALIVIVAVCPFAAGSWRMGADAVPSVTPADRPDSSPISATFASAVSAASPRIAYAEEAPEETEGEFLAYASLRADADTTWASAAMDVYVRGIEAEDGLTPAQRLSYGAGEGFLPGEVDSSQVLRVSITRLARADMTLDGHLVSFVGEVIGEAVDTKDGHWVMMQSNDSSIMVAMTDSQVEIIESFGRYQVKGSTLRVTGVYRVADPNNLGSLDVTAYEVSVIDSGGARLESVQLPVLWGAVAFMLLAAAFGGIGIFLRSRGR